MKKVLLGTSAIALASAFATTANAVEWDVQVGGFFTTYAAYSDASVTGLSNESWNGVDSKQDAEIHFKPSITLDNGIRIGAQVELKAITNNDNQIDESYLFVDGAFGRVVLGSENSAGYLMHYAAPDVTIVGANSGSLTAFMPITGSATGRDVNGIPHSVGVGDDFFRGTLGSTFLENMKNNDALRFTYFTPRFAGFQVGLSYAREDNPDTNTQYNHNVYGLVDVDDVDGLGDVLNGNARNIFDIGVNYVASFGDFDVAASGRWGTAKSRIGVYDPGFGVLERNHNPKVWGAGLNLGYAGFTVGGSFAEQNDGYWTDGQAWDAGVSYETGPWGFSFTYMRGRSVDHENYNPFSDSGSHEKLHQYLAGVSYTLAKGVALNAFGAYVDFKEDYSDGDAPQVFGTGTTSGDNMDGWVVGTAMKISF